METWREIPEFPGYEVSNHGRVRSYFKRVHERGGEGADWQIASSPQRTLRGCIDERGYHNVILRRGGKSYGRHVHRLVLSAFAGSALPGFQCAHNNGDASDNRLENLRYDTPWGNAQDRRLRDGKPPEHWVPQLRQERKDGATLKELGDKYHYAPNTIWSICRGRLYADCDGPIAPKRNYKLTDEQVREIRRRIAAGEVQRNLAKEYGVSDGHISHIKAGHTRKAALETAPKL